MTPNPVSSTPILRTVLVWAGAVAAGAACAAAAAILLGATAGPGVAIVAVAFGLPRAGAVAPVVRCNMSPRRAVQRASLGAPSNRRHEVVTLCIFTSEVAMAASKDAAGQRGHVIEANGVDIYLITERADGFGLSRRCLIHSRSLASHR